jgi:tRNA-binding protein
MALIFNPLTQCNKEAKECQRRFILHLNKNMPISWEDFEKIDIRVGTILEVDDFPAARKPSYKLTIDFGSEGIKKSSAQITHFYNKEMLPGLQVIAVINFPVKQIANFFSECLVLGVYTPEKEVVLLSPLQKVKNGAKIG